MIIELYRAWTPEDMKEDECGACGHPVAPSAVIADLATGDGGTDMGVACPACIAYFGERSPERFPTIEVYEEALRRFPRPMYESREELEAAAEEEAPGEDPWDIAFEAAWVWRARSSEDVGSAEDVMHITPTVLYRIDQEGESHTAAVVEKPEKGRAMIVFRSEEEAEKYRQQTGKHPEEEGFKPVSLDLEDLANLVEMHGCTHVAMPEPWTGKGAVDFFAASDFIEMLRKSVPA